MNEIDVQLSTKGQGWLLFQLKNCLNRIPALIVSCAMIGDSCPHLSGSAIALSKFCRDLRCSHHTNNPIICHRFCMMWSTKLAAAVIQRQPQIKHCLSLCMLKMADKRLKGNHCGEKVSSAQY